MAVHAGRAGLGPDDPVQPERGEPSITRRFTILVIDDDDLVLSMLTELLSAHGHQVLPAPRGRDGMALARAEHPDLILVDYHMPVMDGSAVTERLRTDETTRRIPVVALTSSTAEDANKLVAAGCIGFIPKPFDAETFPGLIIEFVRATVARRPRPATP